MQRAVSLEPVEEGSQQFVLMVVTGLTHSRCVIETSGIIGNVGPLKYN